MLKPDDNAAAILDRFDQTLEQYNRRITALELRSKELSKIILLYGGIKLIYKALKK